MRIKGVIQVHQRSCHLHEVWSIYNDSRQAFCVKKNSLCPFLLYTYIYFFISLKCWQYWNAGSRFTTPNINVWVTHDEQRFAYRSKSGKLVVACRSAVESNECFLTSGQCPHHTQAFISGPWLARMRTDTLECPLSPSITFYINRTWCKQNATRGHPSFNFSKACQLL